MESLLQDVRFGARSLVASRRFTLAAVVTLALGIGANTAMFSVVHAVLLEAWPYKDPARVVVVSERQANGGANVFSTQDFLDWKEQGGLLAKMGAHVAWQFNLSRAGEAPERIAGGQVSYDLLPLLGVEPLLGRVFTSQEDVAGAGHFVVLSETLWRSRYKADAQILGRTVGLNGDPYTVVGVMPAGFSFFGNHELLWTPLQLTRQGGVGGSANIHWLSGYVRLPDGVSLRQARAELDGIAARLHHADAASDAGYGVFLQSLDDAYTSGVRPALWMLMGCVGFVLLIACSNVANLLLARGAARRREMAVRTALGASPLRIVRQLLTESVVLAFAGGALGVGLAYPALRGMLALDPPSVPRMEQVGMDGGVLAFSLLVSLLVGVVFGLAPALRAAHGDVNDGLRERAATGGRGLGRHRSVLVMTETALACILLIATGLALKSLWSLRNVQLGFVPGHVLTFRIAAPAEFTGQGLTEFYRQVAERVRAVAGVQSATLARDLPLSGVDPSMPIVVEGKNPAHGEGETVTRYRAVGEQYFSTLEIPVMAGRGFDARDTASAPAVAVVSESLARQYWPGESAVGKRLKPQFKGSVWCVVVGVVGDVRHWGADVDTEPTAYYPVTQIPDAIRPLLEASMAIAVRSTVAQSNLLNALRGAVSGVDANVPLYDVKSLGAMVDDAGSLRRFDLSLLSAFSGLALLLAAVGVYAVMAYTVSQRTREIGVRMALGAHTRDVFALILKQGAGLALGGAAAGVVAAILLRRVMASVVYGLSGNDPVILCVVPMLVILVVLVASYVPARRAARVDPMVALRYE